MCCLCVFVCVELTHVNRLTKADLDGEGLGVGVSFDEQHPHYAVLGRDVDLVLTVEVLEKRARIPHGLALS